MPQNLVLNLVSRSVIPQKFLQGSAVQNLFFDLVDEVDPQLGHVLRQDDQNRAYGLSALQVDVHPLAYVSRESPQNLRLLSAEREVGTALQFFHDHAIAPETSFWWRITFLDDELFDHLTFLWTQLISEPFQLGTGTVSITRVAADMPSVSTSSANWLGMAWASSCSYRDLYEAASPYEQTIHIQFLTPTAFEAEGYISPMPTVEAVFHPLRRFWNRYSGLVFAPSLIRGIVPLSFDIKTEEVCIRDSQGRLETVAGCMGKVSFRVLNGDPLITKRINALSDFSSYCSVGLGTLVGMGAMRRLSAAGVKHHDTIHSTTSQP